MTGWLFIIGLAAGLLVARVAFLRFKPYKACGGCSGRGHCVRCRYTGKVLRVGARFIRPELRRR